MVYLPIYLVVDTFPVIVTKGIVLSPLLDKYLLPLTSQNQNLPRDSIEKNNFNYHIWKCIFCWILGIPGNYATFGFCKFSLDVF